MDGVDPAASPGRNPPWEYDELILALDVYFREPRARQSKADPAIADLSRVLRALPMPIDRPDPDRFRNVNGAFMKLQNFKAVDPEYTAGGRTGLGAGATERERTLFERYANNQDELHALARRFADASKRAAKHCRPTPEEDEEGVVEGRVLYRVTRPVNAGAARRRSGRCSKRPVGSNVRSALRLRSDVRRTRTRLRRVPSQAAAIGRQANDVSARSCDRVRQLSPDAATRGTS